MDSVSPGQAKDIQTYTSDSGISRIILKTDVKVQGKTFFEGKYNYYLEYLDTKIKNKT